MAVGARVSAGDLRPLFILTLHHVHVHARGFYGWPHTLRAACVTRSTLGAARRSRKALKPDLHNRPRGWTAPNVARQLPE